MLNAARTNDVFEPFPEQVTYSCGEQEHHLGGGIVDHGTRASILL